MKSRLNFLESAIPKGFFPFYSPFRNFFPTKTSKTLKGRNSGRFLSLFQRFKRESYLRIQHSSLE
ncbi:hypothetical protein CH380_08670 [Leptospira adleri]|uniref:Uncharacterized protein n=1 Tax=Leptospira adleri TaxID=2023186 RepID=A0A2M9YQ41_9LEPT|nr:hypothetical protein CH380_08670 [Leptospira adleri]PJZ60726.1 hypothetical protein CH376_17055 [Leptospira adleri]